MCHELKKQPQMLVRPVPGHKGRNTWPILNVWLLFLCFYFQTDHTHTRWWVALGKQKLDENTQCRARSTHNPLLYYPVVSRIFHSFYCEKRAAEGGQRAFMVLAFKWKLGGMNFLPCHISSQTQEHEHWCGDGSNCHEDSHHKLPKCLYVRVSLGSLIV